MDTEERKKKLVKKFSDSSDNIVLFHDQIQLVINSINREEVKLSEGIPSNVSFGYSRTKLLATSILVENINPENQQKEIQSLLVNF